MKVSFHLRKLPAAQAASALLLLEEDVSRLLDLCVRLGADRMPALHRVADGFLLRLPAPTSAAFPGVVRLRGLSDHLLLPVDAELVPTLLPDEAAALVRQRGLIFLPAGRVLAFDPQHPLALPELLDVGPVFRRAWQPLPEAPPLAPVLRSITLELPPKPDALILDAGGEDIGVEPPQPADASPGAQALSKVQAGVGRGLMNLGQALGLGGLARLGAGMMQSAIERAPGMMEKLFGKQEAAMRWLLQQFQAGNLEQALRRAIPFSDDAARGGTPATEAGLPVHNLLYSLQNLLGMSGRRPTYVLGREDLFRQLMEEYRKAAERAAQQGDYRRAAFIYGKLLRDYRAAAHVLLRGGLHHDAAVLFLMRVGDRHAAARAFAAAGEFDHALDLYREMDDHLAAAELLRQLGEEEAAVAEYRLAAEKLVADRRDYLAAGDLMLNKAHARPEALAFFQAGWKGQPADSALPCALRLARLHAEAGEKKELLGLVDEAEQFFAGPGNDLSAGQFWNEAAKLGLGKPVADLRETLHDRALLSLTHKLRQRIRSDWQPPHLVSTLFGPTTVWSAAQASDAQYAWKAALKRQGRGDAPRNDASVSFLRVGYGAVTAACLAAERGALFVGFEDGQVAVFYPSGGALHRLPSSTGFLVSPVVSLAVDADGEMLAVLHGHHASPRVLKVYLIQGGGNFVAQGSLTIGPEDAWLAPTIIGPNGHLLAFWDGERLRFLEGAHLIPAGSFTLPDAVVPSCAFLLSSVDSIRPILPCLIAGTTLWHPARSSAPWQSQGLGWSPAVPKGSTLRSFAPSWIRLELDVLELAGLTEDGVLNWSQLDLEHGRVRARNVLAGTDGYLAAALVRSGFVAAVSLRGVDWLRCGREKMKVVNSTRVALPGAVACFVSQPTDELLVVCQDGTLARVPIPQ